MTAEELYNKLEELILSGYGSCKVLMEVPDETGFEDGAVASYMAEEVETYDKYVILK